ncbi:MAG: hypothetical protein HGA38_02310 [Candidatus Moranbacteria bacterium]|nr:hypothetical protein [Candidatus Moranbacteria bacterium]
MRNNDKRKLSPVTLKGDITVSYAPFNKQMGFLMLFGTFEYEKIEISNLPFLRSEISSFGSDIRYSWTPEWATIVPYLPAIPAFRRHFGKSLSLLLEKNPDLPSFVKNWLTGTSGFLNDFPEINFLADELRELLFAQSNQASKLCSVLGTDQEALSRPFFACLERIEFLSQNDTVGKALLKNGIALLGGGSKTDVVFTHQA